MAQYNVITLQNLKTTSEVEYRTIVCGTLLSTGSTFASQLDQNTFNPLTYSLEINGSTTSGSTINVDSGSIALGPYPSNRTVKINNNQYTVDNHIQFTLNQGNQGATVQIDQTLPKRCADMTSGIIYLSKILSKLSPNNNATFSSSRPGPLELNVNNVDVNGIAVFNVSGNTVFDSSIVQQIGLYPQNTNLQFVVINVYGKAISWSGSNIVDDWFNSKTTGQPHTIWNFYEATTLNFDSNMKGAILAPYAALVTSSNIDGVVAVQSLDSTAEIHHPLVIFPTCTSTPIQTTISQHSTNN
jgi:choice-of-anchor A domain-containing protein